MNTDVRHRDVVLHVQTEDKGELNPCIETLVYVGGQILERRRRGYREALAEGGTSAVVQLMEGQHRALIEQIQAGGPDSRLVELGALRPSPQDPIGDEGTAPHPAADEGGPTLDRVILDYLNAEAEQEHLVLLMDAESDLAPGGVVTLRFDARTSLSDEPVPGASIRVKMISPSSEPTHLGEGTTDHEGRLELRVSLPAVTGTTAALIVRAESSVGEAEIKHLI
ncbi:MAG: hypothetical protein R3325_04735 [Thermoanaerobaculia bacterium]|nr:hypothetical protein [Thermoanaerobaculia bacterium]